LLLTVMAAQVGLDPDADIHWVTSTEPSFNPLELFAEGKNDAADLCANEPARVARAIVDRRFTDRYDYALQPLNDIPYDKWREYDAEDTMRFYALRLHDAGFIKSTPQKIIADGTDWRFLNELKHELKA
jgi:hypothetical protein